MNAAGLGRVHLLKWMRDFMEELGECGEAAPSDNVVLWVEREYVKGTAARDAVHKLIRYRDEREDPPPDTPSLDDSAPLEHFTERGDF